jgi:hypothetical protein
MFVLRLSKYISQLGKTFNHSGKPDGMYVSCYPERGTKKMRISTSVQKISARMFNTADEAADFYRDHVVPTQLWFVNHLAVFVVEVQTETKIVIKSVSKDAVRQL